MASKSTDIPADTTFELSLTSDELLWLWQSLKITSLTSPSPECMAVSLKVGDHLFGGESSPPAAPSPTYLGLKRPGTNGKGHSKLKKGGKGKKTDARGARAQPLKRFYGGQRKGLGIGPELLGVPEEEEGMSEAEQQSESSASAIELIVPEGDGGEGGGTEEEQANKEDGAGSGATVRVNCNDQKITEATPSGPVTRAQTKEFRQAKIPGSSAEKRPRHQSPDIEPDASDKRVRLADGSGVALSVEGGGPLRVATRYSVVQGGAPVAEEQPLELSVERLLAALVSVAHDCIWEEVRESTVVSDVHSVLKSISAQPDGLRQGGEDFRFQFGAILNRVQAAERSQAVAELAYWINVIQFTFKFDGESKARPGVSKTALLKEIKNHPETKVSMYALRRYLDNGTKACAFAGAGSMYLIVLLACARVRTDIPNITGDQFLRLARMISRPTSEGKVGKIVRQHLIPAISFLHGRYSLKLCDLFPPSFLWNFGCPASTSCFDLARCGVLFEMIAYHDFVKVRDSSAWAHGFTPASVHLSGGQPFNTEPQTALKSWTELTGSSETSPATPPVHRISTKFNPNLEENKKVDYRQGDHVDAYQKTVKERELAEQAEVSNSIEAFGRLIRRKLAGGTRSKTSPYTRLDTTQLNGESIRIDDANGDWIVVGLTDMPEDMRQAVMDLVESALPELIREVNTREEGIDNHFQAIHISIYNRYAQHAQEGAPMDADIASIRKAGKGYVNSCLNVPRGSQESQESPAERDAILDRLASFFNWISERIQATLPDDCQIVSGFVDVLPGNHAVPCYPFSGLVVNFNVSTRLHKDKNDGDFCVSVAFRDGEGGDLCLKEPGIVCHSRSGDVFAFRSSRTSHFNLDYIGKRISFVFHTE